MNKNSTNIQILDDKTLDEQTLEQIKKEIYRLSREFCPVIKLSENKYKLYLHDGTPIEFQQFDPLEIDRFYDNVKKYCKEFPYIISYLSFETKFQYHQTEQLIGNIDYEKTRILQQTQPSSVVCYTYQKNLFTPENVLLGAIILGINFLAIKFLNIISDDANQKFDPVFQRKQLHQIIDYTNFLLKDRFVSQLTKFYYQNYDSIEQLFEKIFYRIRIGKIHPKYHNLILFIKIWKKYNKILSQSGNSLEVQLNQLEQFKNPDRIYEYWVFYKTLSIFTPKMVQNGKNHERFANGNYTVEYHYKKDIGWFVEKGNVPISVFRLPDVIIKKDGKIIAILDAKNMRANKPLDEDDENSSISVPDRNILNQMLIYLDYGKDSDKSNLGIVLLADDRLVEPVNVKQEGPNPKNLYFLSLHPNTDPEKSLKMISEIIFNQ